MQYGLARTRVVNNRAVGVSRPGAIRSVVIARQNIPFLVRWSFLLFVFLLPTHTILAEWGFVGISIPRISGLLFFVIYFFYYNPLLSHNRSFPHPPGAMWWFVGYVAVYALNGFFVPEEFFADFRAGLFTLVQLIFLFWFASGLLNEETMARSFLLTYSIATTIVALGLILQLPGFSVQEGGEGRISVLGVNANLHSLMVAVGALILIDLYLNNVFKHSISKVLVIVLILIQIMAIVRMGSRGGFLAFMIGCMTYSVPFLKSKRKWAGIVLGSFFAVAAVYLTVNNPFFAERIQKIYFEGNMAGREEIFPVAIEMILERPLFGWHPVELQYELGWRGGWPKGSDVHNSFLHLLLEVGLVGAIPFFVGLGLCGWAAWKACSRNFGLLPLALLLTLLAGNMSGTYLVDKLLWLVLALCVAAGSTAQRVSRKRLVVLLKDAPLRNTA